MFSFLVTAHEGAWDLPAYEYDRSRFLEYTSEQVKNRFTSLTAETIEDLKSFPALFAYEGHDEPVRIGYLRHIRERGRSILIEYEFDEAIGQLRFGLLKPVETQLDIENWEMSRTHWAVKDEDLFEVLSKAAIIDRKLVESKTLLGRVEEMRFKVALSFAGEHRAYVASVADELNKRLGRGAVFYDKDFAAQLARPNLDTLLQRIYLNNSDLVVVFLCADYEKKEWCGLEWRAIRVIIKNKNDHAIMFLRFDNADVSGSFSVDGYVNLEDLSPKEAADLILERVRINELPVA